MEDYHMSILENIRPRFLEEYSNLPMGKYVSVIIVRKTESETILRTEGSGEDLSREVTLAGRTDQSPLPRVLFSKRKQTAVERRTGRELLRAHNALYYKGGAQTGNEDDICALNRNNPCGVCIDCMLYGYAVGGGGAQKSRIITDDAFSILGFSQVTDRKTFNALYDNSTMRDPFTGQASSSINEDPYIKPETHFLDIETVKDVTYGEFVYALGNILRSTRYGAVTSRLGKFKNHIVSIVFSDCEIFSNLELTQTVYDRLADKDFPLKDEAVFTAVNQAIEQLKTSVYGKWDELTGNEVKELTNAIQTIFKSDEAVKKLLAEARNGYPAIK